MSKSPPYAHPHPSRDRPRHGSAAQAASDVTDDPTRHVDPGEVVAVSASPTGSSSEASDPIPLAAPAEATALVGFGRVVAALILADACCILAGLLLVHAGEITRDFVAVMLVAPIIWVFVFHSFDLYGVRHLSPQEEFRRLISATALAVVLITVGTVWWDQGLDRSALVVTWLIALVLELSVRRIARWQIRAQKRSGHLALRTLIVGTNDEAEEMAESLAPPVRGFIPLGFVASSLSHEAPRRLPLLGSIDDLVDTIGKVSAECVFVASSSTTPDDVCPGLQALSRSECRDACVREYSSDVDIEGERATGPQTYDAGRPPREALGR